MPESSASSSTFGSGLCGMALAAAACIRGLKLAMNSQGQGGRFNVGQYYMPKLKGAKKMAVLRPRKPYGSHGARKVPRRYELYDKLEEIDETTPWYTVLSEPEEALESCRDVPIMQRYPWAGPLNELPKAKQRIENDTTTALEPYFGSLRDNPPPMGRTQNYVHRRGWPRYNHPPWINRPLIGTGISKPNDKPFSKDRRPREDDTWAGSRSRKLWEKEEQARK